MTTTRYEKYAEAARIVERLRPLGWMMDSGGDAAIVHAPDGRKFALKDFMPAGPSIVVCDSCFRASCWKGIFMCEDARDAGLMSLHQNVLKLLGLEHEQYFSSETQ